MKQTRHQASVVKELWKKEGDDYRNTFIEALLDEEEKITPNGQKITTIQTQAIYDLIAFYTMLSLYEKSGKNIRMLNYFYYPWWRNFLYEIIEKRDELRHQGTFESIENQAETACFNKEQFKVNTSFITTLKRLDNLCGFDKLDKKFIFYTRVKD